MLLLFDIVQQAIPEHDKRHTHAGNLFSYP
jgi:hypothetical protein